jgi:hypothetical protein
MEEEKKTKIMVATNLYQIDPIVYAGHLQFFFRLGKAREDIVFLGPWRSPIDKSRNDAATLAMYWDCDYIFFYDDDMYFPDAGDLLKMIDRIRTSNDTIHILQALAFIRGYPFKPMMFKKVLLEDRWRMEAYEDYEDHIQEDGLVKCDAVGCCATIIDTKLFKMIPQPWFETGQHNTEDIYFCAKAAHYIGGLGIYTDTTVEIGHLLDKIILTKSNRDILKKIHEEYNLNQLFLPDPTFIPMMKASRSMMQVEEERVNVFEHQDKLPFKEIGRAHV